MKEISGKYKVIDCEHIGDIRSDEGYLIRNGCKIISRYWDRTDCGEAYIEFTCPENKYQELASKFGSLAQWETNDDNNRNNQVDNKGIKFEELPYPELSESEIKQLDSEVWKSETIDPNMVICKVYIKDGNEKEIINKYIETCPEIQILGYYRNFRDNSYIETVFVFKLPLRHSHVMGTFETLIPREYGNKFKMLSYFDHIIDLSNLFYLVKKRLPLSYSTLGNVPYNKYINPDGSVKKEVNGFALKQIQAW